jgi:hypothetical protein
MTPKYAHFSTDSEGRVSLRAAAFVIGSTCFATWVLAILLIFRLG